MSNVVSTKGMRQCVDGISKERQGSNSPLYDRACNDCGWVGIDIIEPITAGVVLCPACGEPTVRAWLTKPSNVIGDAIDLWSRNGEKHPVHFRSKIEHKRWLKEKGYAVKDEHIGLQGSDKSPHSTKWQGGGKEWLANAEELAKRHGGLGTKEPQDEPFHVTWRTGELTPAQVAEYRAKNR